jgi:hypothetical protein
MSELHTATVIADADLADDVEIPARLSGAAGLLRITLGKITTYLLSSATFIEGMQDMIASFITGGTYDDAGNHLAVSGGGGGGSSLTSDPLSGAPYTKPLVADFPTAVNNSANYVWSDKTYGILVKSNGVGFASYGRYRAKPVGNFDIYAKVAVGLMDQSDNNRCCIAVRDSATGKLHGFGLANGSAGKHWATVQKFNSDASFNSDAAFQGMETTEPWLRLNYDGVNFTLYWGDGYDWNQMAQVGATSFMASFDQVGMLIQMNNKSICKLLSWSLVAPV